MNHQDWLMLTPLFETNNEYELNQCYNEEFIEKDEKEESLHAMMMQIEQEPPKPHYIQVQESFSLLPLSRSKPSYFRKTPAHTFTPYHDQALCNDCGEKVALSQRHRHECGARFRARKKDAYKSLHYPGFTFSFVRNKCVYFKCDTCGYDIRTCHISRHECYNPHSTFSKKGSKIPDGYTFHYHNYPERCAYYQCIQCKESLPFILIFTHHQSCSHHHHQEQLQFCM